MHLSCCFKKGKFRNSVGEGVGQEGKYMIGKPFGSACDLQEGNIGV